MVAFLLLILQSSLLRLAPSRAISLSLKEECWFWNPLTFITAVTSHLENPRFDAESVWCGVHILSSCLLGSPSLRTEAFLELASALNCTPRKPRHLNKALKLMLEFAHTKIKPILCMLMPACESIICILTMRETGSVCQRLPLGEDAKWCLSLPEVERITGVIPATNYPHQWCICWEHQHCFWHCVCSL